MYELDIIRLYYNYDNKIIFMDKKLDESTDLTKKSEVIMDNFLADSYESFKKSLENFFEKGQTTGKESLQMIKELQDANKKILKNYNDL